MSSVRKIRYITGRLGNAKGGLSAHLSGLSPDFEALAIDATFLQRSFGEQILATRAFCDIGECHIIANSYGAYLYLQSLIDHPPNPAKVMLLSPVLGRAMNTERMLFSRPPREKTLRTAIETQRLGMPSQLKIITGKDDESCDWELATQFSAALGADITVLEGEGHTLNREKISQAVASFLKN